MSAWVTLALLGKARGIRGELFAQPLASNPERFDHLGTVHLTPDEAKVPPVPYQVESTWWHDGRLIVKIRGVDSMTDAEKLRGWQVCVPLAERAPLEEGEYYFDDLIGCAVWDRKSGEGIGTVTSWSELGGGAMLEIDRDWLLPFVKAICIDIDVAGRRIGVDLPPGLREVNQR